MLRLPAHKRVRSHGFSMLEVVVALAILSVGVMAAAALTAKMLATGRQSKVHEPGVDPGFRKTRRPESLQPERPAGLRSRRDAYEYADVGNLGTDVLQSTTCPGAPMGTSYSATVAYYDNVSISLSDSASDCPNPTAGCFSETVSGLSGGSTVYSTTYHSPDGQIVTPTASTTAPTNVTFHRRWIIEGNAR